MVLHIYFQFQLVVLIMRVWKKVINYPVRILSNIQILGQLKNSNIVMLMPNEYFRNASQISRA